MPVNSPTKQNTPTIGSAAVSVSPKQNIPEKSAGKIPKQATKKDATPFWEKEIAFLSGKKESKFKPKELIQFYRGVGSMLKAQMNTSDALYFYSKGLPNRKFADKLMAIRDQITNGVSIKEAFRKAKCFNDMTLGLVQSGSDSGRLDEAFAALAKRLVTDEAFKKKLKKVVMIPSIVIPILLGTFIVSQIKIVPQVEGMLAGMKQEPDPISKAFFILSHFIQDYWWLIVGVIVTVVLVLRFVAPARDFVLNLIMAKVRVVRKLVMSLRQMTLLSTITLLHSNGINLARSIRVAANTLKGTPLHNEVLEAAEQYEKTGLPLATAFEKYTSVDEQVCHMMSIGERSAAIDENLSMLSGMYEEEADAQMEALTHIVNAIVLCIAVGLIAAVFISAFLPIFLMGPRLMNGAL